MKSPSFRLIAYGSPEYEKECLLRDQVLRRPLGLRLMDEDLQAEQTQIHFGLFDQHASLIACVIAVLESSTSAKVRQMAVAPDHAGKGHGSAILRAMERHLMEKGFRHLSLHARATAIGFYQKLGYIENSSTFTEVGIPHVHMEKDLVSE